MVTGLGGGFAQVAQEGFSTLAQLETLFERIKLERIRSGVWLRFATGEIQR